MAVALGAEEEDMHSSLHPSVATVLRGKRLLLWRALLRETNYPDLAVVDDVIASSASWA